MNVRHFAALSVAACAALANTPAHAQVISNGGFELAGDNDADAASWSEIFGGAEGTLSVRSDDHPSTGGWHHRVTAVGGVGIGGFAVVEQNSAASGLGSLPGETSVSLSFDAATTLGPGGVAFYTLRILNRTGAIVAESGLVGIGNTDGLYQSYTSADVLIPAFDADPNDFYSAFVSFSVNAGAFDGSVATMDIDNVVVTVIPGPGAAAVLGIGMLGATRRRRTA